MSTATFTGLPDLEFDNRGYSYHQALEVEQKHRRSGEFICDLSYLDFIRAAGTEAVDFLHGQLTNDLHRLDEGYSQVSGYCNVKGRLLCICRIHHDQGDLLLQAHQSVTSHTLERLRKYVMRSAVELTIDEQIVSFGVVGRECSAELQKLIAILPTHKNECRSTRGLSVICHSAHAPLRYQIIGTVSLLQPLWQRLSQSLPVLGSWAWASLDIEQGLATVFSATSEQFVPQMLNLDIIGAVSFDKGCYPGQEIVARMHYLGKSKTRMILGKVNNSQHPPLPGDKVYAVGKEQSIGLVVNGMPGSNGYDVLATARLEHVGRNDLQLRNGGETPVRLGQLPYRLQDPEQKLA